MAYSYNQIAAPNTTVDLVAGSVIRYNDVLLNVVSNANQFLAATNWILDGLGNLGILTYVVQSEVPQIDANTPNSAIYLQSGQPDEELPPVEETPPQEETPPAATLTDKTIAGFTKAFTLIQEGRTRQLSAEQLLLIVKTAAEAKASISDANTSSTTTTLSAAKINDLIVGAKNALFEQIYGSGVAPESLNQIVEIAQKLTDNDTEFGAFINTLAGKLSFTEAQSLTTEQKTTARANIDAASTGDVTAAITAAVGDPSTIDIDALANSIVTPFPAALPTA